MRCLHRKIEPGFGDGDIDRFEAIQEKKHRHISVSAYFSCLSERVFPLLAYNIPMRKPAPRR